MKDTKIEKISKKIEALLFYVGDFMEISEISKILDVSVDDLKEALDLLKNVLLDRGVVLLENDSAFSLGTLPEFSDIIEKVIKTEFQKDLSPASLETLSVILYKAPVTKKEIEYIRGVNCSFSIRNLLMRGLIERKSSKLDDRVFLYSATSDCMLHLGITKIEDLPDYTNIKKMIDHNLEELKPNEI